MSRLAAYAVMTAMVGAAIPHTAFAGVMPRLVLPQATPSLPQLPPPVPAMAAMQNVWFAVIDGQTVGPMSDEAMVNQMRSGRITSETLVWRAGMGGWVRAAEADALQTAKVADALKNPRLPVIRDKGFSSLASR